MNPPKPDVNRAIFYAFIISALILAGVFSYRIQIGLHGLTFEPAKYSGR